MQQKIALLRTKLQKNQFSGLGDKRGLLNKVIDPLFLGLGFTVYVR